MYSHGLPYFFPRVERLLIVSEIVEIKKAYSKKASGWSGNVSCPKVGRLSTIAERDPFQGRVSLEEQFLLSGTVFTPLSVTVSDRTRDGTL